MHKKPKSKPYLAAVDIDPLADVGRVPDAYGLVVTFAGFGLAPGDLCLCQRARPAEGLTGLFLRLDYVQGGSRTYTPLRLNGGPETASLPDRLFAVQSVTTATRPSSARAIRRALQRQDASRKAALKSALDMQQN